MNRLLRKTHYDFLAPVRVQGAIGHPVIVTVIHGHTDRNVYTPFVPFASRHHLDQRTARSCE